MSEGGTPPRKRTAQGPATMRSSSPVLSKMWTENWKVGEPVEGATGTTHRAEMVSTEEERSMEGKVLSNWALTKKKKIESKKGRVWKKH